VHYSRWVKGGDVEAVDVMRTSVGHANCPLVVLDDKDVGWLVKGGHVEALIELADIAGAVAEDITRHGELAVLM
jgi:hypothetical protein